VLLWQERSLLRQMFATCSYPEKAFGTIRYKFGDHQTEESTEKADTDNWNSTGVHLDYTSFDFVS